MTPGVPCPRDWHHKAGSYLGLLPRLVDNSKRWFWVLRAPHPKSFPAVCSCFGTHWQFGRLKFWPRVNFLFGKSCTFRLSLPGFFTPWIKHGIKDECVLQSSLQPAEHKALCSLILQWTGLKSLATQGLWWCTLDFGSVRKFLSGVSWFLPLHGVILGWRICVPRKGELTGDSLYTKIGLLPVLS